MGEAEWSQLIVVFGKTKPNASTQGGVEFIDENGGGPGGRLQKPAVQADCTTISTPVREPGRGRPGLNAAARCQFIDEGQEPASIRWMPRFYVDYADLGLRICVIALREA